MFKKKIRLFVYSALCFLGLLLYSIPEGDTYSSNKVYVISLEGDSINPVTAEYITKSIDKATSDQARMLVIQMDTPGGLISSTRTIVKKMLTAKVPIVVYISPSGSRGGSAGVFITYASHIAAMAPSTNIGAAHPVNFGGGSPDDKSTNWGELKELLEEIRSVQEQQKELTEEGNTTEDQKEEKSKKEKKDENKDENKEEQVVKAKDDEKKDVIPDADPMSSKILNDTVAFIESIAKERNRNVEWAVDSVVDSDSITNDEALEMKVIEYVAKDVEDLLGQINGVEVKLNGVPVTIDTTQVIIEHIPMDARQKFFNTLADPNIAYFLMILGFYGLMFEITHPGIGAPGIIGAIFLILAFYSMQTLPTNYAGLALTILGLVLLIAEAYTPTFGLLTLGGVVCMVLGSMLLFDSADPIMRVSKTIIGVFAVSTSAISLFLITYMLRNQRKIAKGGFQRLIGESGIVKRKIVANQEGKVFVSGELWKATAKEDIEEGEKVIIESAEGLLVTVKKI